MSIEEKPIIISTPKGSYIDRLMFENEYLFQKFKTGFIINNFADNIHFNQKIEKRLRKIEPHAPKLNLWTSQPINSIKTMKHL